MMFDFKKGFNDNCGLHFSEKPIIAITANIINENSALHYAYTEAIVAAGGVPLIIPVNCDADVVISMMNRVDAVLFSGGADIDAYYFNEENIEGLTEILPERDFNEFMVLRAALDRGIPVFGICRGCQLINIALGGSLYQDLPSMYPRKPLNHSILTDKHLPAHDIEVEKGSKLCEILGKTSLGVNSRHHQAIKAVAPQLKVVAKATDGVVEAVEGYPSLKILGVQWHPENMATTGGYEQMKNLFKFFVSEAKLYSKAKKIHSMALIVDSHCDTPMLYDECEFDFGVRNSLARVDAIKMAQGGLDATITVAYIPQDTPKSEATAMAFSLLARFKADLLKNDDKVVCALPEQLAQNKNRGLKSVMLGIENGLALGDDIANVERFKNEGVVYITLCHNGSNDICDSAVGESLHDGLSEFGKKVISRMNELGVTVDVSHSSDKSTLDALKVSLQPIIASHSSCKALCDHPRNLSDSTIKAIAEKGGVVQVCGYADFLRKEGEATVCDLVDHIEHIISLTSYDSVGVGSDFDGGGGIIGFDGANEFMNVTVELLRRGHSSENIAKIMGGNIMRVLINNLKR